MRKRINYREKYFGKPKTEEKFDYPTDPYAEDEEIEKKAEEELKEQEERFEELEKKIEEETKKREEEEKRFEEQKKRIEEEEKRKEEERKRIEEVQMQMRLQEERKRLEEVQMQLEKEAEKMSGSGTNNMGDSPLSAYRKTWKKQEAETNMEVEENLKKKIFIEFIIDGTYSFTTVFPRIFYILETMMGELKRIKQEYPKDEMQYGLTVFRDEAESKLFSNGEYFTNSEEEFVDALKEITFYGGRQDGKEDFTEAIAQGMCVLQNAGEFDSERGLFFFSDAMPMNDERKPDFTQEYQDGYQNKGVRFAEFYSYTEEFSPKMWMVNGDGIHDEEGKNVARTYSLQSLLTGDLDKASKQVANTMKRILNQCSVRRNR